ncbi:hypothetical protein ACA910_011198 [Epithemia clementina (nom. ined.)]
MMTIPLLLLVIILGSVLTCRVATVNALCSAQDYNGTKIDLSKLIRPPQEPLQPQQPHPQLQLPSQKNWPLYSGVRYNAELDELVCESADSCGAWRIQNCHFVKCTHSHACRHTHFTNNTYVDCFRYAACRKAHFEASHSVMCGMEFASNACLQATMVIDGELTCWGPWSCVSTPNHVLQIAVTVGAHGVVRCLQGGTRGFSCQHLLVYVNHARRACLNKIPPNSNKGTASSTDKSHCAVICEGEGECDKNTIEFRIL